MNGGFQGSAQAVNSLGINIYLAKVFSSLLWKPSRATKLLLASQQALQSPAAGGCLEASGNLLPTPFGLAPAWQPLAVHLQHGLSPFPIPHSFLSSQSPLVFVLEPGTQFTSVCKQAKCGPHHQPAILSLQYLEKWGLSSFLCVCMCVYENTHVCA